MYAEEQIGIEKHCVPGINKKTPHTGVTKSALMPPLPVYKDGLSVLDDTAPEGHVVGLRLGHDARGSHHHHGQRVKEGGVGRHGEDLRLCRARLLTDDFYAVEAANKELNEFPFV